MSGDRYDDPNEGSPKNRRSEIIAIIVAIALLVLLELLFGPKW